MDEGACRRVRPGARVYRVQGRSVAGAARGVSVPPPGQAPRAARADPTTAAPAARRRPVALVVVPRTPSQISTHQTIHSLLLFQKESEQDKIFLIWLLTIFHTSIRL